VIQVAAIARGNDVAAARVLARTLRAHHPDWPLAVLVLPALRPPLRPGEEPFELVVPRDLAVHDVDRLTTATPVEPLLALMRALLVEHLLDRGAERVLLLGADAEVHAPLDDLEALLADHAAVLVPRVGRLPEDGRRPDGHDLIEAGEIDDGLVAVRGDAAGRAVAAWWAERTREAAEAAGRLRTGADEVPPAARFGASPLAAARPVFGDALALLEDPGWNVSYWNLHERPLASGPEGLTAAGRPLRVLRFPGFRADRPWWLSEGGTRVLVLDDEVLAPLCRARAAALLEAGWVPLAELAARDAELGNGLRFDERLRRLHAEALDAGEDFGDVFSPAGAEAFASWLREPAPRGARWGITRYGYDVWRVRPDVEAAYPDLDGPDGEGFAGWLWVHGRPELGLQAPLLPPPPAWVEGVQRRVPPVLVTGYLRGTLGLGEAARGYVAALRAAEVPVGTRAVATDPPVGRLPRGARARPDERAFADLALPEGAAPEVEIVCVNADQLPELVAAAGDDGARDRHTIGVWGWEVDVVPERWDRAFDLVDEVWVYSRYVAENLARAADVPVVVVPLPVAAPDPGGARVPLALGDGFVFLFAFDFFSTVERKNPAGLVEAFTRAFAPGEGPRLVLKTINAEFRPEAHEQLRYLAGDRPDVVLADVTLPPAEMAALFARADCYVSLHRSEGFGLTLAEAMALGKPVIATGYSGNTDFMTPANAYLVDWTLREVGPDAEHYPADGHWAEPSTEHAAALMREVWEDREGARRRGARARADVEATLSARAVGAVARARLERIAARRGRATDGAAPWPLAQLEHRLRFDLSGRAGPAGLRGAARRAMMRALRPYATAERGVDEAMAASLRRLHVELEAERAARERERLRLARLERRLAALAERR